MRTCPNLLKPLILSGPRVKVISRPIPEKKIEKHLAHRKLIDLANYVPSSSPRGVLSFTQRFLKKLKQWRPKCNVIWGSMFSNDFRVVWLRYWRKIFVFTMLHKIDKFSGQMTFFINFEKTFMQKYALLIFLAEYYGFPETEIFLFLKI